MNLNESNILFVSGYAAPYGGNFILLLRSLAVKLQQEYRCRVIFLFPNQPEKEWLTKLREGFVVRFTYKDYANSSNEIYEIINEFSVNLVHTHFEVYDIPVAKAVKRCKRDVKMVWHLHDYLTLDKKNLSLAWLRKIKTHLSFYRQYGFWGKDAYYIGVSAEILQFVSHYRNNLFSYPKPFSIEQVDSIGNASSSVIINGIDLSRIEKSNIKPFTRQVPCFLTFGGESYSKGIPTIFKAAEILNDKGYIFKIKITEGYSTSKLLSEIYPNEHPSWLEIVKQTDNISSLYREADAYISASLCETMSMAIAEASIYGLPIIQSDIPGTMWNSDTPSSFLFKVGDAVELSKRMEEVMNMDTSLLYEWCQESARINTERLDMNVWCSRIIEVYCSL